MAQKSTGITDHDIGIYERQRRHLGRHENLFAFGV
jgi:hypothetical protein